VGERWGEREGDGKREQNDQIKLRIEDQMGVGRMRREIRRWKPRQDLEKKRGKNERRHKVINNVNKYNWSKGVEETKTNG